jgi:hypothetical protein
MQVSGPRPTKITTSKTNNLITNLNQEGRNGDFGGAWTAYLHGPLTMQVRYAGPILSNRTASFFGVLQYSNGRGTSHKLEHSFSTRLSRFD